MTLRDRWDNIRKPVYGAIAFVLLASLLSPASASAVPNPLDIVPSLPSLPDPSSWIVDGFKAILGFIFGDSLSDLGRHLLGLLLAVPTVSDHHTFPGLNNYRSYVMAGAWALLGLTFVASALRYWLSSYTGGGAFEAMTAFARASGSIVMFLVFVPAFDAISKIINSFTAALVANPVSGNDASRGLAAALSLDSLADGGIAMLVTMAAIIMAIVLLVVKVIITALLAVLYVASPLAIALYPVEELSFLLRSLLMALLGILIFPVMWALCFGVFAVLPSDALFPGSHGDIINTLLTPLIALAALVIAFRLPFKVLEMGLQSSISPGITRGMRHYNNAKSFGSSFRSQPTAPAPRGPVHPQQGRFRI